ncbi:MAG: CFI-box-CTERM domain-containing protein [Dehalococcoidia bacterium]
MKRLFNILFALVLVASMGMVTASTLAATAIHFVHVPNDYASIQEAVDAASDGDIIVVEPGTYDAFVVERKANISIIGAKGTTVSSPRLIEALPVIGDAWVMAAVYESQNIRIEGISFDGASAARVSAKPVCVGIAYVDSTGTITHLTVENLVATDLGAGVAVIGHRLPSSVEITDAIISNNKNTGIYVCGGSALEAHFNTIFGNSECGLLSDGGGMVDATYNWWGHESGPWHETNVLGKGNAVIGNVYFKPWLGAATVIAKTETITNGTIDAKREADTEIVVNGTATVIISKLSVKGTASVAAGENASNLYFTTSYDSVRHAGAALLDLMASAEFKQLDIFRDIRVINTTPGTEIEIRLYYTDTEAKAFDETTLRLFWWNGDRWLPCSPGAANGVNTASTQGYSGYIWAKITAATTPSLADLQATPFGGYGHPTETPRPCGCFIATAAYGTNTASEIDILREFRDKILLPNSLGAKLVSSYYMVSPPIASFISRHEALRRAVRAGFVDPVVAILTWSHNLWSAMASR